MNDTVANRVAFYSLAIGEEFTFPGRVARKGGPDGELMPFVKIDRTRYRYAGEPSTGDIVYTIGSIVESVVPAECPDCSDRAFAAYLECACWSSQREGDDEHEAEDFDSCDTDDFDPATLVQMRRELSRFLHVYSALLTPAGEEIGHGVSSTVPGGWTREEQAAHDFWLTRNHHGCGFWDREHIWGKENAEALTKAADDAGSRDLYFGDDSKVYQG